MLTGRTNRDKPLGWRGFSGRQRQLFGVAAMVVYVVLSTSAAFTITGPTTHPSKELYPFFTWSLFSRVNDSRREYHIAVHALDGQTFDPPIDMRRIDVFPNFGDSKSLGYKAVQNLGKALSGGHEDSDDKREQFAARFFGDHDVDYQINRHGYNPLTRWQEGPSSDEIQIIGRFLHGGRS